MKSVLLFHQIITFAISNHSIKYSKKHDKWKFVDLLVAVANNVDLQAQLVCTILLNIGALTYREHIRACLARFCYSKAETSGIGDKLQEFFLNV